MDRRLLQSKGVNLTPLHQSPRSSPGSRRQLRSPSRGRATNLRPRPAPALVTVPSRGEIRPMKPDELAASAVHGRKTSRGLEGGDESACSEPGLAAVPRTNKHDLPDGRPAAVRLPRPSQPVQPPGQLTPPSLIHSPAGREVIALAGRDPLTGRWRYRSRTVRGTKREPSVGSPAVCTRCRQEPSGRPKSPWPSPWSAGSSLSATICRRQRCGSTAASSAGGSRASGFASWRPAACRQDRSGPYCGRRMGVYGRGGR